MLDDFIYWTYYKHILSVMIVLWRILIFLICFIDTDNIFFFSISFELIIILNVLVIWNLFVLFFCILLIDYIFTLGTMGFNRSSLLF